MTHQRAAALVPTGDPWAADRAGAAGQAFTVLAVLVAVIAEDQVTKWWAWRCAAHPIINRGATGFLGIAVSEWYADPRSGAVLDLLSTVVLALALVVLLRRARRARVLLPAALMIGGWDSNLLDRLGMHAVTAPESGRGAVDFIHFGLYYYNFADFFILIGTVLFVCVAVDGAVVAGGRRRARVRACAWVAAVAPLVVVAAAFLLTAPTDPPHRLPPSLAASVAVSRVRRAPRGGRPARGRRTPPGAASGGEVRAAVRH
jgi:lipoprotein signal peptidase